LKPKILKCTFQQEFDEVNGLLNAGYELNTEVKNTGIISTEDSVVYHLKYLSPEEKQIQNELSDQSKITSVKSVPLESVYEHLADGYEIHELYAKTATLVKRTKTIEKLPLPSQEVAKEAALLRKELENFSEKNN
jgi:hypothetical protein